MRVVIIILMLLGTLGALAQKDLGWSYQGNKLFVSVGASFYNPFPIYGEFKKIYTPYVNMGYDAGLLFLSSRRLAVLANVKKSSYKFANFRNLSQDTTIDASTIEKSYQRMVSIGVRIYKTKKHGFYAPIGRFFGVSISHHLNRIHDQGLDYYYSQYWQGVPIPHASRPYISIKGVSATYTFGKSYALTSRLIMTASIDFTAYFSITKADASGDTFRDSWIAIFDRNLYVARYKLSYALF